MKHTIQLVFVFFCCFAASCEHPNNGQYVQTQQHHDDSLRAAIEAEQNSHLRRQNDSLKEAIASNVNSNVNSKSNANTVNSNPQNNLGNKANELIDAKLQLGKISTAIVNIKAKLEVERNELSRLEQFHIGRMKTEREQQIITQSTKVQSYENLLQRATNEIDVLNSKIYSLQNEISQTN